VHDPDEQGHPTELDGERLVPLSSTTGVGPERAADEHEADVDEVEPDEQQPVDGPRPLIVIEDIPQEDPTVAVERVRRLRLYLNVFK